MNHFSHPQHKLSLVYSEHLFKCDGCRQVGIGTRFNCSHCDFDLHTHCAAANPAAAPLRHPFYPECLFHFLPRPPGNSSRYCDACGKDILGFVYHCRKSGYDLHPCCAALPHEHHIEDGLRLRLHPRTSAPCNCCSRMGKSWCYRSDCKMYNLHVACPMDLSLDSSHKLLNRCGGGHGDDRGYSGNNGSHSRGDSGYRSYGDCGGSRGDNRGNIHGYGGGSDRSGGSIRGYDGGINRSGGSIRGYGGGINRSGGGSIRGYGGDSDRSNNSIRGYGGGSDCSSGSIRGYDGGKGRSGSSIYGYGDGSNHSGSSIRGSNRSSGGSNGDRMAMVIRTDHKSGKGKMKKWCKLAGLAWHFVIAAVLGDPSDMIVGVVSALLSQ